MKNYDIAKELFRFSSMLESKKFHSFFHSNSSRFSSINMAPLFDKLRNNLSHQYYNILDLDTKYAWRKQHNQAPMSLQYCLPHLIKEIISVADKLSLKDGFIVPKKDRKFVIKRGENPLNTYNKSFCFDQTHILVCAMAELRKMNGPIHNDYTPNLLHHIGAFISTKHLMTVSHKNKSFEKMLNNILNNKGVDYFLKGYPNDMLVYDASTINHNDIVKVVVVNNSYCSTMSSSSVQPKREGYTLYPITY